MPTLAHFRTRWFRHQTFEEQTAARFTLTAVLLEHVFTTDDKKEVLYAVRGEVRYSTHCQHTASL